MLSSPRIAHRFGLAAATLLIGLATATLARAETIPANALDADRKACIAACVGLGKPAEKCTAACGCSAKAYGEQLTFEEYLAFSNAVQKGEEPPKAALEKTKAIDQKCRLELQ